MSARQMHQLSFETGGFDMGVRVVAARYHACNTAFLSTIGGSTPPLPLVAALTGQGALHVDARYRRRQPTSRLSRQILRSIHPLLDIPN